MLLAGVSHITAEAGSCWKLMANLWIELKQSVMIQKVYSDNLQTGVVPEPLRHGSTL